MIMPMIMIIKTFLFNNSKRVKMIYFDKEKHDIEETDTETFMCRSMSATNAADYSNK